MEEMSSKDIMRLSMFLLFLLQFHKYRHGIKCWCRAEWIDDKKFYIAGETPKIFVSSLKYFL